MILKLILEHGGAALINKAGTRKQVPQLTGLFRPGTYEVSTSLLPNALHLTKLKRRIHAPHGPSRLYALSLPPSWLTAVYWADEHDAISYLGDIRTKVALCESGVKHLLGTAFLPSDIYVRPTRRKF